jgi:hypothetical protein
MGDKTATDYALVGFCAVSSNSVQGGNKEEHCRIPDNTDMEWRETYQIRPESQLWGFIHHGLFHIKKTFSLARRAALDSDTI